MKTDLHARKATKARAQAAKAKRKPVFAVTVSGRRGGPAEESGESSGGAWSSFKFLKSRGNCGFTIWALMTG